MTAWTRASSSANDVSIRQAVRGCRERISRHAVMPSPSCSRTSSTATSGSRAGMRRTASSSVLASPTTTRSSSPSSRSRTPRRTISWSSRRKTVTGSGHGTSLPGRGCGSGPSALSAGSAPGRTLEPWKASSSASTSPRTRRAALRWAVAHAAPTGQPVTAVMAWGFVDQHHLEPGAPFDPHYTSDDRRQGARRPRRPGARPGGRRRRATPSATSRHAPCWRPAPTRR